MSDRNSVHALRKRTSAFVQIREGLRTAALSVLVAVGAPALAHADCEVPVERLDPFVTDNGKLPISDRIVGNARANLQALGIDVGGAYISEPFYNWGALDEGGEYQGVLDVYVNADMERLGLWRGLCFHANGYQIHGNSITGANVGSFEPITSFEAEDATRLFELWFEQHLFDGKMSVRFGQLAADEEFFAADGAGLLINGDWGWAPIAAENLPSAGPAYPLATPGVRVALAPTEDTSLMIGVYNGDPAPDCAADDPQICNNDGLDFGLRDSALLMVEGAYNYELAGGRLPGTIKVGGWNHFGTFQDNRVDVGGNLIEITGGDGRPLDNNYALYVILDQLLWRVPGSEEAEGIGMFFRMAGAPEDRNLIDFYFDVGLTFTGMIPNRPRDAVAIGFAYNKLSDQVQAFDVSTGETLGNDYEALLEIAYAMHVTDGWELQPDFQYIWNPGGGIPGVKDAIVVGARNTLAF